jgi:hypothetical protein
LTAENPDDLHSAAGARWELFASVGYEPALADTVVLLGEARPRFSGRRRRLNT